MQPIDSRLAQRLNAVPDAILDPRFLTGRGLGNEISFHVFDYAPQYELQVRAQMSGIEKSLHTHNPALRLLTINIFDLLHDYLSQRKLWERVLQMQSERGDDWAREVLKAPLQAEKLTKFLADNYDTENADLIFLTGVGNAFPLVRSHSILNSLHAIVGNKPLVLFFPGDYSGDSLRLFGLLAPQHYYRAFRLVP